MDDLIVIILMVIVTVVGAVGRINKNKRPQPQPKADKKTYEGPDDFWEFLENAGGQAEQTSTQPIAQEPVAEVKAEVQEIQPKYTFNADGEGQNAVAKDDTITDEIKHPVKGKKRESISGAFSLRNAVIYSEILNRKYS